MNSVTLLVLAAGMGSRYGGLKQLDSVGPNGETVIDYSVFDAIRAGFNKVVFIIREDFKEEFKLSIGEKFQDRIEVEYVFKNWMSCLQDIQSPMIGQSHGGQAMRFFQRCRLFEILLLLSMLMIFMVN